jgi:hypothetical protein
MDLFVPIGSPVRRNETCLSPRPTRPLPFQGLPKLLFLSPIGSLGGRVRAGSFQDWWSKTSSPLYALTTLLVYGLDLISWRVWRSIACWKLTDDGASRVTALKDCFASLACSVESSYYPSISVPPPTAARGRGKGGLLCADESSFHAIWLCLPPSKITKWGPFCSLIKPRTKMWW